MELAFLKTIEKYLAVEPQTEIKCQISMPRRETEKWTRKRNINGNEHAP
jgi:hypothetical protein